MDKSKFGLQKQDMKGHDTMKNEMTRKLINQAKEDIKVVCDGGTSAVLTNLIDTSDYDELGFIIHTLEQAMTARLIEDGENPDVDVADLKYESNFGPYDIKLGTITKTYKDWIQQVTSFVSRECHGTPVMPRTKRTHLINIYIIAGLTLYRDVISLSDCPAKNQILNKTTTFLPILMMYLFENKLPFKISNFIKDVTV